MKREDIFAAIVTERERQEELHPGETCAEEGLNQPWKLAILMEEVGEIARAVLETRRSQLRKELTEVAAVAVAWLESME